MIDPIVEEVRKVRDHHAARFNYNLDAIFDDLKKMQQERALTVVSLQPKRISKRPETAGPQGRTPVARLSPAGTCPKIVT
jgi:hypothetical protein